MYIFAFLFSGVIAYFWFNRLKVTSTFLFKKVGETIGTVTEIKWIYGKKGSYIQSVIYEYLVEDRIYSDKFTIGRKQAKRKTGDRLLLKYAVKKPQINEVIRYHKNSQLTDTRTTGSKVGNEEMRHF